MTSPLPSHELRVAIDAARAGAQKALEYYNQNIETTLKADKTVLTQADLESEKVIKETILREFPDAQFLAEEGGGQIHEDAFWIIDPIDGTRSFSRGVPTWNILIAYCQNKKVKLGVSYFPVLDGLLFAEVGKGAFCNDEQIHVSNVSSLEKAYVATGSPKYFKNKQLILDLVEASASLRIHDLTFSAFLTSQGKMDALVDAYGKTWDCAPYKVIIEEAGGRITRLDGSEWELDGRDGSVITNGILYDQVMTIVKKYY